ncbi:hypothetical protein [Streptomyces lunalinharesii]|uniref:Uncharacterized protein n=1 Tax=Streptomyces lunalinharesii TaxID=333384 RepID=A0ABN3RFJ9_9ACTN
METVASQANSPERTSNPHPVGSLHPELVTMADELAPRLFAVAQQYPVGGGEMDGHIAAWGLAYEDGRAQVISVSGRAHLSLRSPQSAVRWFRGPAGTQSWLIWPKAWQGPRERSA